VTVEPFVVVRADDGALYYAGIATARREGALIAGARVLLLGRTPHEITALGVGASAEAALAHLQGARSAPAALPSAAATPPAPAAPPAVAGATPSAPARAVVYAGPAVEDRRWTELTGVVESLAGRTLVLRSDDGRVSVDVSSLSENLDRMVTPGTTVKVYGVPVERRFKAMGFFDPGARR
jgi:hypothetical protein